MENSGLDKIWCCVWLPITQPIRLERFGGKWNDQPIKSVQVSVGACCRNFEVGRFIHSLGSDESTLCPILLKVNLWGKHVPKLVFSWKEKLNIAKLENVRIMKFSIGKT